VVEGDVEATRSRWFVKIRSVVILLYVDHFILYLYYFQDLNRCRENEADGTAASGAKAFESILRAGGHRAPLTITVQDA